MPATKQKPPTTPIARNWRFIVRRGLCFAVLVVVGWVAAAWYVPRPDEVLRIPVNVANEQRAIGVEVFRATTDRQGHKPVVVLLHGVEGGKRFVAQRRRTADQLRRQGYATFIVHYFDAVDYDDLWVLKDDGQIDTDRVQRVSDQDAEKWTEAVANVIDIICDRPDVDRTRLAIDGYSLGGFIALAVSNRCQTSPELPDIRAVVVNWGACFAATEFHPKFPPTLFVHGQRDQTIPLALAHNTMSLLTKAGVETELCVVPDAKHVAMSEESNQRTLAFLQKQLMVP